MRRSSDKRRVGCQLRRRKVSSAASRMILWLLCVYSLHSSWEKSFRCTAGDKEANQAAAEELIWWLDRRFLLRRKVRFKNRVGSSRVTKGLEGEEHREVLRRWFGERMDRRGGEGERLLVPSCANLRRSKLLKYWCNTHVSSWDLHHKRPRQMPTVKTRVGLDTMGHQ